MPSENTSLLPTLVNLARELNLQSRLKWSGVETPSNWEKPIYFPTQGYIESSDIGPVLISEVEWLEIRNIEFVHRGRLAPPKQVNKSEELSYKLTNLNIPFSNHNGIHHINVAGI